MVEDKSNDHNFFHGDFIITQTIKKFCGIFVPGDRRLSVLHSRMNVFESNNFVSCSRFFKTKNQITIPINVTKNLPLGRNVVVLFDENQYTMKNI